MSNKTYPYIYTYQDFLKVYFNEPLYTLLEYHTNIKSLIRANGGVITPKMIENTPALMDFMCNCDSCNNKFEWVIAVGPSRSEFGSDDYLLCEQCFTKSYQYLKNIKKNIKMNLMSQFDDITEFQGEYRWLSNFSPCVIYLDGDEYKSVEHAYMSARSNNPEWKKFCQITKEPGVVKTNSKNIKDIDNWKDIKVSVMAKCLEQKFRQEPYRSKLIETGDRYIQEGNRWGDTFWGVDLKTGKGQNRLGHLIMNIRTDLLKNQTIIKNEEPIGTEFQQYMTTGKFPE